MYDLSSTHNTQLCKSNKVKISRWLMLILYLLNCTDIILTLIFNKTGSFIELNPFMHNVINNLTASISLKVVIPAILFIVLGIRIGSATLPQLKITQLVLAIFVGIYSMINIMHIITLLIFKLNGIM